jgi:hypothetical protein
VKEYVDQPSFGGAIADLAGRVGTQERVADNPPLRYRFEVVGSAPFDHARAAARQIACEEELVSRRERGPTLSRGRTVKEMGGQRLLRGVVRLQRVIAVRYADRDGAYVDEAAS